MDYSFLTCCTVFDCSEELTSCVKDLKEIFHDISKSGLYTDNKICSLVIKKDKIMKRGA